MDGAVPWAAIESGLLEDDLADPRRLAEVRTAYEPHLVLGLESGATADDVRAAYRRLAREHHPDRGGDLARFQQVQAAHDALVGTGADAVGSVLPYGCSQCPSRGGGASSRQDVVRCILVAPEWGWLTLDEKRVLALTAEGQRTCCEAPPEVALLCCCFLDECRRLAVGGTKGHLVIASLEAEPPAPMAVSLNTTAPVLAVCAPSGDQSPLLFCSVDGEVLVIDLDGGEGGCVLCKLGARLGGLHAEVLLCPSVPALEDAECFPPEPLLLVGGGDDADGAAGSLAMLHVHAPCAEGDADGAQVVWRATHELPVLAIAIAIAAAPPPPPSQTVLLAAAAGSVVTLHDGASGAALRRLCAGRDGVLYALAFSPSGDCLLAAGSEEVVHGFLVPAGTRRAVMRLTRSGWAGGLNTATINALAFVDGGGFVSGGYDAAITRWQLQPLPPAQGAVGDLAELSTEELRALVRRAGLSDKDCVERRDLLERAEAARRRIAAASEGGAATRAMPAFHEGLASS